MGGKKKVGKKARKLQKKEHKALKKLLVNEGCKSKCCKKYTKSENKRCKRCPCFDLLQKVA